MQNIFEIRMEKGNPKLAIRYAKRIIKDGQGKTQTEIAPGTKVYELVEERNEKRSVRSRQTETEL